MRLWILLVPLVIGGCGRRSGNTIRDADADADTDSDSDSDSDSDTDTDTDTDSDSDTDTDNGQCAEDADEPNDDFGSAVPLPAGNAIHAAVIEASIVDFWTFEVPAAGANVTVDLFFQTSAGNLDLTVYRPTMAQVTGGSSVSQTDDEQVAFVAPVDGTYFVRVNYAGETACNDYDLEVTIE